MLLRILIGAAAGLLIGAVVGSILKSRGGTCPLTCNPIGGALFGAVFGAALVSSFGPSGKAREALANIPAITAVEQFDAALAGPRPVLADFYTDSCPHCVTLAPTIAALAEQYRDRAEVVKVNAAKLSELTRRYEIRGVPTVVLFAGGQEVRRWIGNKDIEQYREELEKAIDSTEKKGKDT